MGKGVDVVGEAEGFWVGGVAAALAALTLAAAALDPHHVACKVLASVCAVEEQAHRARLRGLAAAAVGAGAAGARPVPSHRRAAREADLHRLTGPRAALAFLPFLFGDRRRKKDIMNELMILFYFLMYNSNIKLNKSNVK